MHLGRHRARDRPGGLFLGPIEAAPVTVGEELDDGEAVPDDAVAVPQDRNLAERRRELAAFAAFLPVGVEHRHDELLELLARLLAREPPAHRPAGISAVADDQLEQDQLLQDVAASSIAVRNSAIPLPVSLDVVKMAGCAAGCLAASAAAIAIVSASAVGFTLSALVSTR